MLGQVMTRLHLNWCCQPAGVRVSESNTCNILVTIFVITAVASIIMFTIFTSIVSECVADSCAYWEHQSIVLLQMAERTIVHA